MINKKSKIALISLAIIVLFFLLALHTCSGGLLSPLPYRHLSGFRGTVVDVDTKEPIPGAAVLAVYYMSVYSVGGEMSYIVDGQEAITDEEGEFEIPAATRLFALYRGYPEGALVIFKPGYGVFPDHKRSEAVGVNKSWPPAERHVVYELPKLKTREERRKNLPLRPRIKKSKYKTLLKLINEERRYLGFDEIPLD